MKNCFLTSYRWRVWILRATFIALSFRILVSSATTFFFFFMREVRGLPWLEGIWRICDMREKIEAILIINQTELWTLKLISWGVLEGNILKDNLYSQKRIFSLFLHSFKRQLIFAETNLFLYFCTRVFNSICFS